VTDTIDSNEQSPEDALPIGKPLEGMGFDDLNPETQAQMLAVMATGTEEQQAQVAEHLGLTPNEPAPQPEAQADEVIPAEEAPQPAEPDEPRFAGVYKSMANVELVTKILEEGQFEKLGAVILTNHDPDELETIRRLMMRDILRKQKLRRIQTRDAEKAGREAPYFPLEVEENTYLHITEEERENLMLCSIFATTLRKGAGYKLFDDPEDHWTNLPQRGDHRIAIATKDYSKSKDPVQRIRSVLNLSVPFQKPLWASGFHLEIEGPGVLDQLKLETQLLLEKVEEGRASSGFVYSASAVFMNRLVVDFILDNVKSSTAGTTDKDVLKDLILITDLENMALATAATIYPDGYNLQRKCLDSKGGCGHVMEAKIQPRRMLLVRENRVSDAQFQLLSKKSGFVDHEIIRNYQKMTRPEVTRYIRLKGNLALRMRVPTLAEYDRVASAWMDRMVNRAKELIGSNASETDRQIYLSRANNIALIMAFGHWFDAFVEFGDELDAEPEVIMTRTPAIKGDLEAQYKLDLEMDKMLEDLSSDNETVDTVIKGVEAFINAMTLATAVITKEVCPVCGKDAFGDADQTHPHVININAVELFFTLLHHKIQAAGG